MGAEIKPEPTPEEREAILLALAGLDARGRAARVVGGRRARRR